MTEEEFIKKYHVRWSNCCLSCRFFRTNPHKSEGLCMHKDSRGEATTSDYMVCDEFKEL